MKACTIICLLIGMMLVFSCSSKTKDSLSAYRQWMDNADHGIVVTRETGDMRVRMQWVPPELQLYRDFHDSDILCDVRKRDSLTQQYQKSIAFLLTFESIKDGGDILWKNISTREEFEGRVHLLNFRMNELVQLEINGEIFHPVLSVLENDYGIPHSRKIHLVFSDSEKLRVLQQAQYYDIVLEDEVYMTGISHFKFDRKSMEEVPSINFWACN